MFAGLTQHTTLSTASKIGLLAPEIAEGEWTQTLYSPLGAGDLLVLAMVIALLNASVMRCWESIKKSLNDIPREGIPFFTYYIPQFISPSWHFFAPNPGCHDLRILTRQRLHGVVSPWTEPQEFESRDRTLLEIVWCSKRYTRKLLLDLINSLMEDIRTLRALDAAQGTYASLQLTVGYLGCLKIADFSSAPGIASEVQFAIARTGESLAGPEMIFRSNWHAATPTQAPSDPSPVGA